MNFLEQRRRFGALQREKDYAGIRQLLLTHPAYFSDPKCRADMMIDAAMFGETPELIALLNEMGVELNIAQLENRMKRPIQTAANLKRWDTVRWLVEHGAEINYEVEGREPYCVPLSTAIMDGRLDVVKLLVEAGAILDVCDRRNKTPLGWAGGQPEIAAYLRAHGAIDSSQARNYQPPPPQTPVVQYLQRTFGEIKPLGWQPVVPAGLSVAIYSVFADDFCGAITDGLSSRAMTVPPGMERYRHAELAMPLGSYWPENKPERWNEKPYVWAIQWLIRLVDYPFESGIWLGNPYCLIANGDPPEPLSDYTAMTCWLLLVDKAPLMGFTLPDGNECVFYTVIPIHTAERDYERSHGLKALLEKFEEQGVTDRLDPNRPCAV